MPRKIDISYKTILFITAFVLALWIVYLIRDLLIILFFSVIFMSTLEPLVNVFSRIKIPRALGIALTYVIIIGVIAGMLAVILPPLVEQSTILITNPPPLLEGVFTVTNIDETLFQSEFSSISKNVFNLTLTTFDFFLTIIFLLVITFYLLLEKNNLEDRIPALFLGNEERAKRLITHIQEKLGAWLRGQLLLSLIIAVVSYIGLTLLQVPYALPLSLVAGIMEVVPVIGPII